MYDRRRYEENAIAKIKLQDVLEENKAPNSRGSKNRHNFGSFAFHVTFVFFFFFLRLPFVVVLSLASLFVCLHDILKYLYMYIDEASVGEEFANRIDSRFVPGVGA